MKRNLCFSFICTADGVNPEQFYTDTSVQDIDRAMKTACIDTDYTEGEDAAEQSEYAEVFEGFSKSEFACTQGQGILPAREFFTMLDSMGVIFQDVQTMGTLGGPLGGVVPDFDFTTESPLVVLHMRATPVLMSGDGAFSALSEASWERMRVILRDVDPWHAAHGCFAQEIKWAKQRRLEREARATLRKGQGWPQPEGDQS